MNKKEIEKAKDILKEIQESNRSWLLNTNEENCEKIYLQDIEAIETILQYIDQLEQENNKLQDIIKNKVHYIKCENCGIEMRVKRNDAKYCKKCSQKLWYKNLSEDKKKQRAEKSRVSMRKIRLARKDK